MSETSSTRFVHKDTSAHYWKSLRGGANLSCKRCGCVSDVLATNGESWCWACKVDALEEEIAIIRSVNNREDLGVAGDECGLGNECGRLGCPNCQD
jgi:hypothetical protein